MPMGKFIYVFDTAARDQLLAAGFQCLKADDGNQIWVFSREDADRLCFDYGAAGFAFVLSDTLTF